MHCYLFELYIGYMCYNMRLYIPPPLQYLDMWRRYARECNGVVDAAEITSMVNVQN